MSIKRIYFILFLSFCLTVPSFAGIKSVSKNDWVAVDNGSVNEQKKVSTKSKKSKKKKSVKKNKAKEVDENDISINDTENDISINDTKTNIVDNTESDNYSTFKSDDTSENSNNNINVNDDISYSDVLDNNANKNIENIDDNVQKKENINVKKYYSKAKNEYFSYNIQKAQLYLDEILKVEDYQKAYELKNKILLLEEKISFLKKNIISLYSIELKRTLKEANFYEGLLLINKILALNPTENITYSKSRLVSEEETFYQILENQSEQKLFKMSIDCFSNGKFTEAKKYIKKIAAKYPRFLFYVSIAECYQLEENNAKRVKVIYNQALQAAKSNKLYEAKNFIELAYSLDKYDLKVLILMEQINMEMM